ncbi:tRNA 2-thiocytidine biosynthesis protein TtcA [bacterium]|nr:tRNA 2-thiocytidine biosynthesis protein TtcA [bacterium]
MRENIKESKRFLSMHKLLETAIHDYQMINPGDHVLVGLSGGKDSSMLLKLLARKKISTTNDFRISAVFVKMGFRNDDEISGYLRDFSAENGVTYFEITKSLEKVMASEKKQACYLCSRTRRLALFDLADEISANVIAFGHHRDDFVQTFMMNLLFNGTLEAMKPNNPFFKGKYRIIRPMLYIKESSIRAEIENSGIRVFDSGCPFGKVSERAYIRSLLEEVYKHDKTAKNNVFKALYNQKLDFLLKEPSKDVL